MSVSRAIPPYGTTPDSLCAVCGKRLGQHFPGFGYACPKVMPSGQNKPDLRPERRFTQSYTTAAPPAATTCPTCKQKMPRVIKVGDIVQSKRGYFGLVVKPSHLMPETQCWVHYIGKNHPIPQHFIWLTLVHGTFQVTERIAP